MGGPCPRNGTSPAYGGRGISEAEVMPKYNLYLESINYRACAVGAVFLCLILHPSLGEAVDCSALNDLASKDGVFIPGDDAGRVVIGAGRLQFYSAPSYSCKMRGIFVIERQMVDAYTKYGEFTSVVYLRNKHGKPVMGWVKSGRLKPNGLSIAPTQGQEGE